MNAGDIYKNIYINDIDIETTQKYIDYIYFLHLIDVIILDYSKKSYFKNYMMKIIMFIYVYTY